ncbi:helix-turn-helix transcriptional regulator [Bilifractor sp. HCP3S3_D3]|uniref:helix-turn-helix transcriptional regulator n=1 Tax=Bilifractor sp. HCP3S3_D3 TaxID=3438907 RepID=UPI003F8CB581
MKCARSDVEYRLNDLQGQVFSACRMGAWCFNEEKQLYISTAPHQEEYHLFLRVGGVLDQAIGVKEDEPAPHILDGKLGLVWIAEWVQLQNGGRFLVILGPTYLKNTSVEDSLMALDRQGISQHLRRQYLNVLGDVPVLSFEMLRQYACMLHYTCYQEAVSPLTLAPQTASVREGKPEDSERFADRNDYERMTAFEEMLLQQLSEGAAPQPMADSYPGELQNFGLDSMRQIKDNLLIFTALCARTAVKSGVPVYTAKTMENEWIRRIEDARGFSRAWKIRASMYNAFLRQVRQTRESTGLSKAVRDCRSYIQANYMNEISLEEIARHCGYAEYYLSRKFAKETGMKISDYIHSVRVDAAKLLLVTTSREIQDISDLLHFGNRSHFDRVFRQHVGVSPAKFREQGGQLSTIKETT